MAGGLNEDECSSGKGQRQSSEEEKVVQRQETVLLQACIVRHLCGVQDAMRAWDALLEANAGARSSGEGRTLHLDPHLQLTAGNT